MFWACKACQEKDARIADLKEQVAFLRELARRPETSNKSIPQVTFEADAVLSGQQAVIEIKEGETGISINEIESERDRLLAGTY